LYDTNRVHNSDEGCNGHVRYCCNLGSVVLCKLSQLNLSETTGINGTKLLVVVPLSGETRSYFYTLVIIYLGVCSLNLYTQLYVCKYMYQQLKYLYCSIQHY
jgi:hypothetical protein